MIYEPNVRNDMIGAEFILFRTQQRPQQRALLFTRDTVTTGHPSRSSSSLFLLSFPPFFRHIPYPYFAIHSLLSSLPIPSLPFFIPLLMLTPFAASPLSSLRMTISLPSLSPHLCFSFSPMSLNI